MARHRSPMEIALDNDVAKANPAKPYKAQERAGGFWLVIDTRTGEGASYPNSEGVAKAEARTLNRAYGEALAELRTA